MTSSSEAFVLYYGESASAGLGSEPLSIMPRWKVASPAGDVAGNGFDDLLVGDETGGIYDADGGAAAVYQSYNESTGPAGCDGDGFNRADDCDLRAYGLAKGDVGLRGRVTYPLAGHCDS